MANPAHFADGISNTKVGNPLYGMGQLDPTVYKTWFHDFFGFTSGDWTVTKTQAGATQAAGSVDGGALVLTNTGTTNADYNSVQWAGGSGATIEPFLLDPAKDFFMKARFKLSTATTHTFIIGLAQTDTTPDDVNNGVYFFKTAAATNIAFGVEKSNTQTLTNITTMADDTFVEVGLSYIAHDGIVRGYYKNSSGLWAPASGGTALNTNFPNVQTLTPTIGQKNASASANSATIDYLFIAAQR